MKIITKNCIGVKVIPGKTRITFIKSRKARAKTTMNTLGALLNGQHRLAPVLA